MESRKFEPFVVSVCLRYGVCTALEAALEAVEVHTRDQRPRVPLPPPFPRLFTYLLTPCPIAQMVARYNLRAENWQEANEWVTHLTERGVFFREVSHGWFK